MTLTFALSVRNFIEDIGAYAGFAAVVAVALFALLLFAQAREIKRLRDWGADAHDRIGELERSVAAALDMARRAAAAPRAAQTQAPAPAQPAPRGQIARGRAAAAAAGAPAAGGPPRVARTAAPVRPQPLPSAPAGVGGPALASATVLIPLPGAPARAAPQQPAAPARAARPAVAAAATGAGARERAVPAATAAAAPRERVPEPALANGHRDDPPTELAPRRAAPAPAARPAAAPRREPARPAARPRPAAGRPAPGGPARGGGRPGQAEPEPPHGRRRLVGVLVAVLALVVVGAGVFLVLGRGDDEPSRATQVVAPEDAGTRATRRAARETQRTAAGPPRDQVVVAVLNGTGVTGLAARVMGELTADGWRQGPIGDASDSQRGVTVVEYRNNQQAAADEVARSLGLTPDTVSAIRPDSEQAACALQNPCTAQVVVTVGADRNPTQ